MRIYLAGSIFTPYERSFLADCAEQLRAKGFDVFVPHEQGLVGLEATPEAVFAVDADGVESADAVLATGLGAGILLDATVVRMLLAPALVGLFGDWNWWMPAPAAALLRLGSSDRDSLRDAA
jgi:hypothetical protein